MRTPGLFIQHQITNLRVLAELLAAHVDGLPMPTALSREALLCRESMLTISVLLPKLEATRRALLPAVSPSSDHASSDHASSDHGDTGLYLSSYRSPDDQQVLEQRQRVCENCD